MVHAWNLHLAYHAGYDTHMILIMIMMIMITMMIMNRSSPCLNLQEELHLGGIFRRKEISLVNVDNEWFATFLTVGF